MLIASSIIVALGMSVRFAVQLIGKKKLEPSKVIWFGLELLAFATIIRYYI